MDKRLFSNRCFLYLHRPIAVFLLFTYLAGLFSGLALYSVPVAEAAQSTIDSAAQTAGTSHLQSGSQTVFISDQVGYKFYRDGSGECVYAKTTNAGSSWGSAVIVDDQGTGTDCIAITVWYDRWTPGDSGNYIHIVTIDTTTDDVYYNRIDTANSDTRLLGSTAVDVSANSGQAPTFAAGANYPTITKGTDGTIYASVSDSTDSFVIECTTNCNLATSWSETGTNPLDLANDYNLLVPLAGGSIMLINRDISAEDIRTKIWNNTSWSAAWTTVDANATDNTTYDVGLAATVSSTTVYIAYTADNATLGTDDDIRTARYVSSAWTTRTDVLTNDTKGLTGVAIARDENTGTVYVGYSGRTTAGTATTGNVYWKSSTDGMGTWGTQTGPINSSAGDINGVDLNISSNQRVFESWFNATNAGIFGDTIADLVPGIIVSANGSQTSSATAPLTNTYIGGSFALAEQASSRDVTSITITENGTVDASTVVSNIKLYYELDTTAPYNCASESYAGTETQFGSTDTNGFSGANGVSTFNGSSVTVSRTSAMCVYVVLDVSDSVGSGQTLNVTINNPSTDVGVSSGEVSPATAVDITGSTTILNDNLTQAHYHWRNDNGSETTATSKTSGTEDTNFTGYQRTPVRLRLEVSNEGGASSAATQYRLEYGAATSTCNLVTSWTDVGAAGGDWDMSNSANLTDGNNTTDISNATGGVTNENTTFLSSNGGVKDTSSQTGSITLTSTQFLELEYSITASTTAADGNTYCFRLSKAGTPLDTYSVYPRVTISADVNLTVSGTQSANMSIPSTNQYLGGTFVFTDGTGSHTITGITFTENGTVDAQNGLDNIKLFYDLDTSAPYDCASESYAGTESQFGSTDTNGFSSANGTSTFAGSVGVSLTQTMCGYIVFDVTSSASNAQTVDIEVTKGTTDITLASGGTAPSVPRAISGSTNLQGAVLTQAHYHFRNTDGTETTATSKTAGAEDTPITNLSQSAPVRVRIEVSNEGSVTSPNTALRLEYGTKVTSCSNVGTWTDVGAAGGAWDMYNSPNLTDGNNTTNIANGSGGVTDENSSFKATNAAVKDTSSQVATTTFTSTEFLEAEFAVKQTTNAAYDTTYCFRLSNAGTDLNAYSAYPEVTTAPERDFEIQRGTVTITGTSSTIVADTDYVAPASTSTAFIRITNSHYTGAGIDSLGGNQNAADVTAYILDPENLLSSVTFARTGTTGNTRVSWEIVEFIGSPGSDNEMIVHDQRSLTYGATSLTATGTAVSGVADDNDVVVFITGQMNPLANRTSYSTVQSTSAWSASTDEPVFTRGSQSTNAVGVSYAVVEFAGANWKVQRVEHVYAAGGVTETENITPVNSVSKAFVVPQVRLASTETSLADFGQEAWISSMGAVSFLLQPAVTTPASHTAVAWVIENTQTTAGAMQVTQSDGTTSGGTEPLSLNVSIGTTLTDLTNASLILTTTSAGTGTAFPRPIAAATINSSTTYEVWRSDTGTAMEYRGEVIEWPTAGLAFRQNDYRFYYGDTDPWPVGTSTDLGENTPITGSDEPLGDGERAEIRMSLTTLNATLPELSKSFKLQYASRDTTCGAISEASWNDVGAIGSGAVWRGFDNASTTDGDPLSGDPPAGGELKLATSDSGGTYEEENDSALNPYRVTEGDDIEYAWFIEQNGASAETFYCFRMVESNGTTLGAYADYPQLRTASFSPKTQNWRFFDDENDETPTIALAAENTAPIDIANNDALKLRVTVKETENIARDDVRFKLQYSQYSDFSTAFDVAATSTCTATSTWCYFDGGGTDNAVISTATLSDADPCSGGAGNGCGTHNENAAPASGFRHESGAATEYEFTVTAKGPRISAVYYFRLYDTQQDIPVTINTGEKYPSLVIEGPSLSFSVAGLPSGTATEGVTTDATSTASSILFGSVPFNTPYEAAQRLSVDTNATEGYQMFMYTDEGLINAYGSTIPAIAGTNAAPVSWDSGCSGLAGCFGYHAGDDLLEGSSARFGADDSYAAFATSTLEEVMYSSLPANDTHDIVYKLQVSEDVPAGEYQANVTFVAVPTF